MKRKFSLLLFILVLLAANNIFAQDVYKFRAKNVSACDWNDRAGDWEEWDDWRPCNVLITINLGEDRITIYNGNIITIDIYKSESEKDGSNLILNMLGVDEEGRNCKVRFVYNEYEDERSLYIIYYETLSIVYTIKPLSRPK